MAAGARIVNLSLALVRHSGRDERELTLTLDTAARRGVLVVAAAGNDSAIGSTAITRHPWVIPVTACDLDGRVLSLSNLGGSIGTRGLRAPGKEVTSLRANGEPAQPSGTSIATTFVTGALALLWSEHPKLDAAAIRFGISGGLRKKTGRSIVPPLLDAWGAYQLMKNRQF